MKTVVITGSSRGFGFCLAREFRRIGCNIVLSAVNEENLRKAEAALKNVGPGDAGVIRTVCDVTDSDALQRLWDLAKETFGAVDIWVNNAGVNSPDKPVWELTEKEIGFLLDTDLKGTVYGSKVAFAGMKEQGFGQIYNVEGYGSNDAMMTGLTLYGTSKRAVTYFTRSLAKESHDLTGGRILVCRLTPGIMITDFLHTANGGSTRIELPEKTRKIYNILGDRPETIAEYAAPRMLANTKNDARIIWLTNRRSFGRFLTAGFRKRDFFA